MLAVDFKLIHNHWLNANTEMLYLQGELSENWNNSSTICSNKTLSNNYQVFKPSPLLETTKVKDCKSVFFIDKQTVEIIVCGETFRDHCMWWNIYQSSADNNHIPRLTGSYGVVVFESRYLSEVFNHKYLIAYIYLNHTISETIDCV